MAVGVERYTSVCHPHMSPPQWMAKGSVVILVLFSVLFNVCRFLEFETAYETEVSLISLRSPQPLYSKRQNQAPDSVAK